MPAERRPMLDAAHRHVPQITAGTQKRPDDAQHNRRMPSTSSKLRDRRIVV